MPYLLDMTKRDRQRLRVDLTGHMSERTLRDQMRKLHRIIAVDAILKRATKPVKIVTLQGCTLIQQPT